MPLTASERVDFLSCGCGNEGRPIFLKRKRDSVHASNLRNLVVHHHTFTCPFFNPCRALNFRRKPVAKTAWKQDASHEENMAKIQVDGQTTNLDAKGLLSSRGKRSSQPYTFNGRPASITYSPYLTLAGQTRVGHSPSQGGTVTSSRMASSHA